MKKKILLFGIFIIMLLVLLFIVINNYKNTNPVITNTTDLKEHSLILDTSKYKSIEINDIKKITINICNEASQEPIYYTNQEDISNIYNDLGNIVIGEETDIRITDSSFSVIIETNDKTVIFSFEGNNYIDGNNAYTTDKLYDLKKIIQANSK